MEYQDPTPLAIKSVAVSTGWGSSGSWKVYDQSGKLKVYTCYSNSKAMHSRSKSVCCVFLRKDSSPTVGDFILDVKCKGIVEKLLFELPDMLITWCCVVQSHMRTKYHYYSWTIRSCHVTRREKINLNRIRRLIIFLQNIKFNEISYIYQLPKSTVICKLDLYQVWSAYFICLNCYKAQWIWINHSNRKTDLKGQLYYWVSIRWISII